MDLVLAEDDDLIVIAADDDRIGVLPSRIEPEVEMLATGAGQPPTPERIVVLGWNHRAPMIVKRLDEYVAPGSAVEIVHSEPRGSVAAELKDQLTNLAVSWKTGDPSHRAVLSRLELESCDHVIVLAKSHTVRPGDADTATLLTLVHLRDLARRHGYRYSIVTEIEDIRNRHLAQRDSADDFIVSDEIVSLMLAQVSEDPSLNEVLSTIFDAAGAEIYLRPAASYVALGHEVTYATVVEAARGRGETAIGYRSGADTRNVAQNFGVHLNPPKTEARRWSDHDHIVVLATS
jgi:hypothetical protein